MIADRTNSQREVILDLGTGDVNSALDVGCGNGEKTFYISEHVKQVVGIDPNQNVIQAAQNNFARKNLVFQTGQAESLTFPSSIFDSVMFNESFHHIPVDKQAKALEEACRVLGPKGKMLIVEPVGGRGSFEEVLKFYDDERDLWRCAAKSIESNVGNGFDMALKKEIHVEYSCKGFDDLYQSNIRTKPHVLWKESNKQDVINILDRCEKTPEGDSILDYFATVWLFIKR